MYQIEKISLVQSFHSNRKHKKSIRHDITLSNTNSKNSKLNWKKVEKKYHLTFISIDQIVKFAHNILILEFFATTK